LVTKVIHIDPRFTRTSANADRHIAIRAVTDIVLLGAVIRDVLENELYFKEYVQAYTNASTIIAEDYADTEDLDGLFSGYDPETGTSDNSSWSYDWPQHRLHHWLLRRHATCPLP